MNFQKRNRNKVASRNTSCNAVSPPAFTEKVCERNVSLVGRVRGLEVGEDSSSRGHTEGTPVVLRLSVGGKWGRNSIGFFTT